MVQGEYIIDQSSRSFHQRDIVSIINDLKKDYGVIIMSEFQFPIEPTHNKDNIAVAWPQADIRVWAGLIECADHFLGCDSVGQHIAKSVGTTVTTVIGSTYPINISYPDDPNFDIIDIGESKRTFSPIRLTGEDYQDMMDDECMEMTEEDIKKVITSCRKRLGKPKEYKGNGVPETQQSSQCCDNPAHKNNKGFGS